MKVQVKGSQTMLGKAFQEGKTVMLPSGRQMKLKHINPELAQAVIPEDMLTAALNGKSLDFAGVRQRLAGSEDLLWRFLAFLLIAGVAEPRFVDKPVAALAADEIRFEDVGGDLPDLIKAIVEFNDFARYAQADFFDPTPAQIAAAAGKPFAELSDAEYMEAALDLLMGGR